MKKSTYRLNKYINWLYWINNKIGILALLICGLFLSQIVNIKAQETIVTSIKTENDKIYSTQNQEDIILENLKENLEMMSKIRQIQEFPNSAVAGGEVDTTFSDPNLIKERVNVNAVALQSDGKILVGGLFNLFNDIPRFSLVRLNVDGSLDTSFNPDIFATVNSIVLQNDGKILIGGFVTNGTTGASLGGIARLNTDGSLDSTFNPSGSGANSIIEAIFLQTDGKILIGGLFSTYNGTARSGIARINSDGSLDTGFDPGTGTTFVYSIAVQNDGKILIGGSFFSYNGTTVRNIARLNANGSLDASFNTGTGPDQRVYKIAIQPDGKILLVGAFYLVNGLQHEGIVRLNSNGSVDGSLIDASGSGDENLEYYTISMQPDGKFIVGGNVRLSGAFSSEYIIRLNSNGTVDISFLAGTHLNNVPNATVLQPDGKLVVGGIFTQQGSNLRNGITRLNSNGSVDTFNVGRGAVSVFTGTVNDTAIQSDGKILICGDFDAVGNSRRENIARLNPDGFLDTSFNPGNGPNNECRDLVLQSDGKLIIGGYFTVFNSVARFQIARLNTNGSLDSSFLPPPPNVNNLNSLAIQPDGKILYGRDSGITRLNNNGSVDNSFSPATLNSYVTAINVQTDGKILIGGGFTTIGGIIRNRLARLNSDGSLDNTFNANVGDTNAGVFSLATQPDGKILIGGTFTTVDTIAQRGIARLNSDGSRDTAFNPGVGLNSGSVHKALFLNNSKILIGGSFSIINGINKRNLARLNLDGSVDISFNADINGNVLTLAQQQDGKILTGGQFSLINNVQRKGFARLLNSLTNLPARTQFDFDGDRKTDISIFRPAPGEWWLLRSSDGGNRAFQFGSSTDKIVPADFTGDGKTDIAFWRESSGEWFILRSEDASFYSFPFGASGDIPAPGDYDNDGKADPAIFRPSNATWYILRSSDNGTTIRQFGTNGDKPVAADYDGDGKDDIAIFRPSVGQWWINRSSNQTTIVYNFGTNTDRTVQADYTGDGKTDVAFFRPSSGEWFILRSEDSSFYSAPFGASGDIAAPGDYDGDGKTDLAIFRPSNATWYLLRTTAGFQAVGFGINGDIPTPNAFVR